LSRQNWLVLIQALTGLYSGRAKDLFVSGSELGIQDGISDGMEQRKTY
jgi:hypothetical protein